MFGGTRIPPRVMTSAIFALFRSMPISNTRRKSPSVKIPLILIESSQITVKPRLFRVISSKASRNDASGLTVGISVPVCIISLIRSSNLRPSAPPG
ncbi:hypothetical [Yersinia pestis KIM10+]|uniref:Uncharacterized protein n=1 Tax=Yersinia pestis TaxID=632 RepID=Q8CLV4_YERPE|nr:hypothetical [Yersinia pestis KIM10+]